MKLAISAAFSHHSKLLILDEATSGLDPIVRDDILDITSSLEVLGKPVGSDEKNQKTTYVTLFGVEEARRIAGRLSMQAVNFWKGQGESCAFLLALTEYLTDRTY